MKRFYKPFFICIVILVFVAVSYRSFGAVYKNPFEDVSKEDWFYDDVSWAVENGIMNGVNETSFSPIANTSRGMIVTMLWRMDSKPAGKKASFTDVDKEDYYYDAVSWACENNIVTGYSASEFRPEDSATREQFVAIVYRFAVYKGITLDKKGEIENFSDYNSISSYAVEAFEWGISNGIINGTSDTLLSPKAFVQRCQSAAILNRLCSLLENIPSEAPLPEKEDSVPAENHPDGSGSESYDGSSFSGPSKAESSTEPDPLPSEDNEQPSEKLIIEAGNITASPGETVSLMVDIKNNPGIIGLILSTEFDSRYLELQSVKCGEAFSGILDMTASKTLKSGARFLWDSTDINDENIKDGTILEMIFKVSDDAPSDKFVVSMKCSENDAVDKNLKKCIPTIYNGSISIK